MHFSHVHTSVRGCRLSGVLVALISSLLLLGLLSGQARATVTYCSSGTTQWEGGASGDWGTGSWSNGTPSASCDTVINGNVTVTFTTLSDHYGNEDTANTDGLTLSGGATLVIQGESDDVQGNWYPFTNLNVGADGLMIDQGSTLDIEGSSATAMPEQGTQIGGAANVTVDSGGSGPANVTNNGAIVASSSDPQWGESFNVGGTVANNGSITDESGLLTLQGQQNTAYIFDNTGSFTIDSGASFNMLAGDGSSFNNTGTFANQGTATLQESMSWNQSGGSESGNPVQLTNGETLQDSSGGGSFEVTNCTVDNLTGTVPADQTITVIGGCYGTTLNLGSGSDTAAVVNDGTITLDAPAGGSDGIIGGAELDNHGTLNSTVGGALPLANQLLVPLVNEPGATVNLTGGELEQTTGSATTNDGTVNIAAGATWLVQAGSFTNNGTLGLQLASPTDLGSLNLTVGSKFNAGGTLAPTLVSGYQPAAGTEFPIVTESGGSPSGSFGSVTGGFSADYSKESASPGYLGIIYGAAASGSGSSGSSVSSSAPRPSVKKVSGGAGKMTLELACAKSAKSKCTYTFTGTVGKTKVASGGGTVKPGKTVTVTLELNKAGTALLEKRHRLRVKLVVSASGKKLKSSTVTVTKAAPKKKK